ncbi:hypothetical protein [Microbacterium sp. NPDC089696]|uniref:hypothetical protein n=1 Tax=Microbacterium sp. NPDC089696 TaxID=3364199 RepID=UPI0037FBDBDD
MPRHDEWENYPNVNAIAAQQGLIYFGREGSPYDVGKLVDPDLWDADLADGPRYGQLFDHTIRFKPRGSGNRAPVMAITAPYLQDSEALREAVVAFCARFGLAARVGDEAYRIYHHPATLPIVFWRPDLHLLR